MRKDRHRGRAAAVIPGPVCPPAWESGAHLTLSPPTLPVSRPHLPVGFSVSSLSGVRSVISSKTSAIKIDGSTFVSKSEAVSPWSGSHTCGPAQQYLSLGVCRRDPSLSVLPQPLYSCAASMVFCIQVPCAQFTFFDIFTF